MVTCPFGKWQKKRRFENNLSIIVTLVFMDGEDNEALVKRTMSKSMSMSSWLI